MKYVIQHHDRHTDDKFKVANTLKEAKLKCIEQAGNWNVESNMFGIFSLSPFKNSEDYFVAVHEVLE